MRKLLLTILPFLLMLLATAMLVEAGARFWLQRLATDAQFRRYATLDEYRAKYERLGESATPYLPHRYLGYVTSPNYHGVGKTHNSLGFRSVEFPARKPKDEFRIVCLGGSTTYGIYARDLSDAADAQWIIEKGLRNKNDYPTLDLLARRSGMKDYEDLACNYTYPGFLERRLHELGYTQVRVINAGAEGYTSYESMLNFELRCLDVDPDLVIVYEGYNDIHTRLVWPHQVYLGDNSGSNVHSAGWYLPLPWYLRSDALRIALIAAGRASSPVDLSTTFGKTPPVSHFFKYTKQIANHTYPSDFFVKHPVEDFFRSNKPVYFKRNLETIAAVAKAHGITPVLLTFACSPTPIGETFDTPQYRAALAEHNDVVRSIGAAGEAHVFDFAAAFPQNADLFTDIIHLTADGGKTQARLIADYLVNEKLLPAPAGAAQGN